MSEDISQDISIRGEGNIVVGKGEVIINPLPPAEARLRHNLGILTKNVETTWIKGVLEKSVHEAALLELGMEIREEAVDNPWRMIMEKPDQSRETLPKGIKAKDIFDEANRLLLILGEPGSGKTTTLLQLARDLIAEVDSAFTQPIPVILNLSTWTNKQQPLDEWLVLELRNKYQVPKRDGKKWLRDRRILPLLDGLDEVKAENRAACVENINQLVNAYGLQGLVVCSRIKDYTEMDVRLAFYRAIYLQPLTSEQIDIYLNNTKDKLASLRATLQTDETLRNMAQSPLILNIMSLAYRNASAETLRDPALDTNEARRKLLFDTYIARMFNRKAEQQGHDTEQTKRRLSWLAQNMQKHNQDVFLIEGIQPSWLLSRTWRRIYFFSTRLISGLIIGLIFWLLSGSIIAITFGLGIGLLIGLIDVWWFERPNNPKWGREFIFVFSSIAIVLIVYFIFGLLSGQVHNSRVGLLFGLIFGLRSSRQSVETDIVPVESLHWMWQKALVGGVVGSLIGIGLGVIYVVYDILSDAINLSHVQNVLLSSILFYGLGFGIVGAILNGLLGEIIETKSAPNQGILLSLRNSALGGLIVGSSIGLGAGLYYTPRAEANNPLNYGLSQGLLFGLSVGLMGVLWYGGFDVIQHYTLRLILIIQRHTPHNYADFLDYAVDRIFLQKVGGGYRFIHRMLLEHFAEMYEDV